MTEDEKNEHRLRLHKWMGVDMNVEASTKDVWIVLEKVYVETVCDLDHDCIGWSSDDCDGYIKND